MMGERGELKDDYLVAEVIKESGFNFFVGLIDEMPVDLVVDTYGDERTKVGTVESFETLTI